MGRIRRFLLPPKRLRVAVKFSDLIRFFKFVLEVRCPKPGFDPCWVWQGCLEDEGYARFKVGGKNLPAYRYSYVIFVGPLPDGYHVEHRCENRPCVNPNHLVKKEFKKHLQDSARKPRLKNKKPVEECDVPF